MSEKNQGTDTDSKRPSGVESSLLNTLAIVLIIAAIGFIALVTIFVLSPDNFFTDLIDPPPTATNTVPAEIAEEGVATITLLVSFTPEPSATTRPTDTPVPTDSPTPEPSNTAALVLPPTLTPVPRPDTATPAPINTLRPSLTPSVTPTFPPPTPTNTPTPTPSNTPQPGPPPTVTHTRSPFPFTKDTASPQYLQNYANSAGCDWLGIAGEVFDLRGNPVPNGDYRVHIWESGVDGRVTVGDASAYGPSGYEFELFNAPRVEDYNVQMETANGTAVSQVYRVQTRASCNQNLLYLVFVQNH